MTNLSDRDNRASFRYDCHNCKHNWCCNELCHCFLKLPEVPSIMREVKKKRALWRIEMAQESPEAFNKRLDALKE